MVMTTARDPSRHLKPSCPARSLHGLLAGMAAVMASLVVGCGSAQDLMFWRPHPSDGPRADTRSEVRSDPVQQQSGGQSGQDAAASGDTASSPSNEVNQPSDGAGAAERARAQLKFDDLAGDPRETEIREGVRRGIVEATDATRFVPHGVVTREQFAAMLFSVLDVFGVDVGAEPTPSGPFSDVQPGRWSYRAIGVLDRLGIMGAVAEGRFEPSAALTRAQAGVAVWALVRHGLYLRHAGQGSPEIPAVVARRDYDDLANHWAQARLVELSGFCRAEQGGDISGRWFGPDRASTRSHATGVLVRALICFETGRMPPWARPLPEGGDDPATDAEVLDLCETSDPQARAQLLEALSRLPFGERSVEPATWGKSTEACVLGLLPGALYANLKTGVPASILVGQAIQETGWCRSKLAQQGLNYHGQKAKFEQSYFRYWDGATIVIDSSESPTGGGKIVRSTFMRFSHPDYSFYSVPERFLVPGLPYRACMAKRADAVAFIRCVGQSWAVHREYTELVLEHRANFRSSLRPKLRLATCDLKPDEWLVDSGF